MARAGKVADPGIFGRCCPARKTLAIQPGASRKAVLARSANYQDGPVRQMYHLVCGTAKHKAGQVAPPS